ncbi:hypothetical protein MAH4_32350 [Sessilibacter sp. MAH4]
MMLYLSVRNKLLVVLGIVAFTAYPLLEATLYRFVVELLLIEPETIVVDYVEILYLILVSILLYSIRYFSKIGRIELVNKIYQIAQELVDSENKTLITGWLRAVFLELVFVVITLIQIFAVLVFSFYLNKNFGFLALLMVLVGLAFVGVVSAKEYLIQKKLRYNKILRKNKKGDIQIKSRVRASETVALFVNCIVMIWIILVFFLGHLDEMHGIDGLMMILLIRYTGITFTSQASSVMRLVRGYVYSESQIRQLLKLVG